MRGKLALTAVLLSVLPWVGWLYVREMERFLMEAQEQVLMGTARGVATALHDRPLIAPPPPRDTVLRRMAEEELRKLAGEPAVSRPPETPRAVPPDEETLAALSAGTTARDPTAAPHEAGKEPSQAASPDPSSGAPPEPVSDIRAILTGLERTTSRIWVVNREYRVLALAGKLRRAPSETAQGGWQEWLARLLFAGLLKAPSEDFEEGSLEDVLASGKEVEAALQGAPRTRIRQTPDGKVVILSAAHPVWNGDEIAGAVIVEETTNSILSVRNRALEQLLLATLAAFILAAAVLLGLATRISWRIRRLRDEAESAIDAQGRIGHLLSGSRATDEIGDLSRTFSAMLERLAEHHSYLETMASRLSHELRTPVAVVRSSLENMKLGGSTEENRVYLERAEEGLARLTTILTRMSEASRLEQSLRTTERERFDLRHVLAGCVDGYRSAFPNRVIHLSMPDEPVHVEGSPDLLAQLLDKLVDNANDFGAPGTPMSIELSYTADHATLAVLNRGEPLPEGMRDRLFASMVSMRKDTGGAKPHLGLGLYVARLIAEFHHGALRAENLPGAAGVRMTLVLPAAAPLSGAGAGE